MGNKSLRCLWSAVVVVVVGGANQPSYQFGCLSLGIYMCVCMCVCVFMCVIEPQERTGPHLKKGTTLDRKDAAI